MKNLFKAFGIFILVAIVASIVAALLALPFLKSNVLVYNYIMQAVSLFGMFGVSAFVGIRILEKRNPFEAVGMKNHLGWRNAGICVATALAALPFVAFTEQLNKKAVFPEAIEKIMQLMENMAAQMLEMFVNTDSIVQMFVNILVIAIIPGLCEELMFRGWIQRSLMKNNNPHVAIWVTAVIFSAIHFQFYGFIPRMILGAILGYAYYYTGSLWASIIMHALNNAVAVVIGFLQFNGYVSEEVDSMITVIPFALASLAVVYALISMLYKYNKKDEDARTGIQNS